LEGLTALTFAPPGTSGSEVLAGLHAENRIGRAELQERGHQRHDADPAPDADGAGQGRGDQRQAQDDADDPVGAAGIFGEFRLRFFSAFRWVV
jgi:hypothetical protein